jgi:hypothetical protein
MSIFTWALDVACHNAFAVAKHLMPALKITSREYKRQLAVHLTEPYRVDAEFRKKCIQERISATRKNRLEVSGINVSALDATVGLDPTVHHLMENINKAQLECFLCRLL